jgi:hypothetical protein
VVIPFADVLGRAILDKAKLTDPRLTREFPRIAGFTAAHTMLSIERRERAGDGAVIATLQDYEAARDVVRELTTIREYGRFAVEVWETVNTIYKATSKAVSVSAVSRALLKAHRHVSRQFTALLQGGALTDVRERPSRTAPYLVIPSGESPGRILLPTAEEMAAGGSTPPSPCPSRPKLLRVQRLTRTSKRPSWTAKLTR